MGVLIPDGNYRGRATGDVDFGYSNQGTEQCAVRFTILDGDHAGTELTWFGFFNSADNITRSKSALRAAGWDGVSPIVELAGLGSKEVNLKVAAEEYNGEVSSKIRFVNPGGVGMKNRMTDDQRAEFARRMRAHDLQNGDLPVSSAKSARRAAASPAHAPSPRAQPLATPGPPARRPAPASDWNAESYEDSGLPPEDGADDIPF